MEKHDWKMYASEDSINGHDHYKCKKCGEMTKRKHLAGPPPADVCRGAPTDDVQHEPFSESDRPRKKRGKS